MYLKSKTCLSLLLLTVASSWSAVGCSPPGDGNQNDNGIITERFAGAVTCEACHGDKHANWSETAHAEALAPVFDSASASFIDSETLSVADQARLAAAKFNFQFVDADGSRGVHNPALARGALDVAEQIVDDLPGQ